MHSNFKKYGLLRRYKEQVALCYAEFRREYKALGTTDKKFNVHEWRLNIESVKEQIKLLEIDLKIYTVSIVSPFIKVLTLIQIKAKSRLKQLKQLITPIYYQPAISIDTQIINC